MIVGEVDCGHHLAGVVCMSRLVVAGHLPVDIRGTITLQLCHFIVG